MIAEIDAWLLAGLKRVHRAKLGVSLSIPRSNRSKTSPLGRSSGRLMMIAGALGTHVRELA